MICDAHKNAYRESAGPRPTEPRRSLRWLAYCACFLAGGFTARLLVTATYAKLHTYYSEPSTPECHDSLQTADGQCDPTATSEVVDNKLHCTCPRVKETR